MNYQRLLAVCGAFCLIIATTLSAQYQRVVLVEDFSSVTCINCPQAAALVTRIAKENPDRIATIQWHLDIPGRNDPFYHQNKTHNDAREDYYGGFNALPQVYVDGLNTNATGEAAMRSDINTQLATPSPVSLVVTQTGTGATRQVSITANTVDGLQDGYRLYVAAVEVLVERPASYFENSKPYYDETAFHDLFRTFASPAEGVVITLNPKQSKTFNYTYTVDQDWDPNKMYVVAWVQDEFNQEMVQAAFSQRPKETSVTESASMAGYSLAAIVPNPATENARVEFSLGNVESGRIMVHDAHGRLAYESDLGRLEEGEHQVEVKTSGLPAGVYTITLSAGEYRGSRKMIVVR